jgi:hypothetical protein
VTVLASSPERSDPHQSTNAHAHRHTGVCGTIGSGSSPSQRGAAHDRHRHGAAGGRQPLLRPAACFSRGLAEVQGQSFVVFARHGPSDNTGGRRSVLVIPLDDVLAVDEF